VKRQERRVKIVGLPTIKCKLTVSSSSSPKMQLRLLALCSVHAVACILTC